MTGWTRDHDIAIWLGAYQPRMPRLTGRITLAHGISTYVLYRATSAEVIEKFAAEVVPAVRETVAAERSR
jgi:hypothetical protein